MEYVEVLSDHKGINFDLLNERVVSRILNQQAPEESHIISITEQVVPLFKAYFKTHMTGIRVNDESGLFNVELELLQVNSREETLKLIGHKTSNRYVSILIPFIEDSFKIRFPSLDKGINVEKNALVAIPANLTHRFNVLYHNYPVMFICVYATMYVDQKGNGDVPEVG